MQICAKLMVFESTLLCSVCATLTQYTVGNYSHAKT